MQEKSGEKTVQARKIIAKFGGWCLCGKRIAKGEPFIYYGSASKIQCLRCYESRRLTIVGAKSSYDKIIDRIRGIRASITPWPEKVKEEYFSLFNLLKQAPDDNRSVKLFLQEIARCRKQKSRPYVVKALKQSPCIHCGAVQRPGDVILIDFPARRYHCFECECVA